MEMISVTRRRPQAESMVVATRACAAAVRACRRIPFRRRGLTFTTAAAEDAEHAARVLDFYRGRHADDEARVTKFALFAAAATR